MDANAILQSPDYINANPATKRAIFDKHIAGLPDFAKANEATQSAIRQRFGVADEGRSYDLTDLPGQAIVNAPASAAKFAGDIYTAVTNPVQTAGGLLDLARGGLRAAGRAVLPENVANFLDTLDNPENIERASKAASAFGGMMADRYGSWERIKRTVAEDPVAAAGDLSLLTKGLSMATKRVAPSTSNVLADISNKTDPLMLAAQGTVGGVNALRTAAGNIPNPRDAAISALRPYVDPGAAAANKFVQSVEDPAAAAAALRATQNAFVTPGAPALSAAERMVEGGAPSLGAASLEQGLAAASPQVGQQMRAREIQQQSAIQQQLARVEQQIQTQAATLAPADLTQLRQVRDTLLRAVADEQATLANTAQVVAQPLPTVPQARVGGQIQARGEAGERNLQQTVITPAYERAFETATDAPVIPVGPTIRTAAEVVGDLNSVLDSSTVPESVRKILTLKRPMSEPEWVSLGERGGYFTEGKPLPQRLTLREYDSVLKALNRARSDAYNSGASDAGVRAANIKTVIDRLEADLASAKKLPAEARAEYAQARQLFAERMVPEFRTGETAKMLTEGSFNMPRTLPSKQVEAFLKSEEGAAQFVRTFESDPRALQSMQQGVLDLYRRNIVDPETRVVDPKKAAAFEQKYARQLDTMEAAGLNVRETMGQVRQDAAAVQQATEALANEAAKFGKANSAQAVVDLALKSPMDMRFVRERLTPQARTALTDELTNRATALIQSGDAKGALKYLTDNKKALTVGFGKTGAKTYADLVDLAQMQKKFLSVTALAPKTDLVTPVTLAKNLTPAQLTDLQVVVNDLKRSGAVAELGAPKDKGAGKGASEGALEAGVSPSRIPGFFIPIVTAGKSALKSILDVQDRRVSAALFDLMVRDPDKLIPILEQAAKAKAAAPTARAAPRPLTIPASVNRLTGVAPAAAAAGREDNQNAMAR